MPRFKPSTTSKNRQDSKGENFTKSSPSREDFLIIKQHIMQKCCTDKVSFSPLCCFKYTNLTRKKKREEKKDSYLLKNNYVKFRYGESTIPAHET
jgi:hypothetical protein